MSGTSVVGIDLGNSKSTVSIARNRGIDVALNEVSNRWTPSLVGFGYKERHIGESAKSNLMMHFRNTISDVKLLLRRKADDPVAQRVAKRVPFRVVENADGYACAEVQFKGETLRFTMEQVLAMYLGKLKEQTEAYVGTGYKVSDCVLTVPCYFSDIQRQAVLDAAAVAGLHPLRLINETTAAALAYGIYKTDLSDTEPRHVAIVDYGQSALTVSIVAFKKGELKVLASESDIYGGADLDDVLLQHFAAEFSKTYAKFGVDVLSNKKATLRLRQAVEGAKKVLSMNAEAKVDILSLMNDVDVHGQLTRDDFVAKASHLFQRWGTVVSAALAAAKVDVADIASVEIIGGSARVPLFQETLERIFGKPVSKTLNADEAVSKGAALACAQLSPAFRVREFNVADVIHHTVYMKWTPVAKEGASDSMEVEDEPTPVFKKGSEFPSSRVLTFRRREPFTVWAMYGADADVPPGTPLQIATYHVDVPSELAAGEKPVKIKLKVRVGKDGVFRIDGATAVEKVVVEEVVAEEPAPAAAPAEPTADDGGKAADSADAAGGEAMETSTESGAAADTPTAAEGSEAAPAAAAAAEAAAVPAPDAGEPKRTKTTTKTVKHVLPLTTEGVFGIPADVIDDYRRRETKLTLDDKEVQETAESRNAVESYVYNLRGKLYDDWKDYVEDADREQALAVLAETEDWLYGDGEDAGKEVYVNKHEELKKLGDPVRVRYEQELQRPAAVASLTAMITKWKSTLEPGLEKYAHIDEARSHKDADAEAAPAEDGSAAAAGGEEGGSDGAAAAGDDAAFAEPTADEMDTTA